MNTESKNILQERLNDQGSFRQIEHMVSQHARFTRQWAMPNKHTFLIEPIGSLIKRYVGNGLGWIDPFAGENSPAETTNDLNPEKPTAYHLDAEEFADVIPQDVEGVIFDPPYSARQIKECYEGVGRKMETEDAQGWYKIKDKLAYKIKLGGLVICCGWNSNGFGLNRGFKMEEILLVAHGGNHNDTIVTVERKIAHQQMLFEGVTG